MNMYMYLDVYVRGSLVILPYLPNYSYFKASGLFLHRVKARVFLYPMNQCQSVLTNEASLPICSFCESLVSNIVQTYTLGISYIEADFFTFFVSLYGCQNLVIVDSPFFTSTQSKIV